MHESFSVSASFTEKLKPQIRGVIQEHQIEGLSFMYKNITGVCGCVLAHSMGKAYQF